MSLGAQSSKVLLSEERKDAEQRVIFKNEKYRRKKLETFGIGSNGQDKSHPDKNHLRHNSRHCGCIEHMLILLSFFILSK